MLLIDVRNWVVAALPADYLAMFSWVESSRPEDAASRYCIVQQTGGAGPIVETRYPRFRVLLLGKRNERSDAQKVMTDIEALLQAAMGDAVPCGAASIRAITEPVGPGFTTENRAWAQVDFEIII